MKNILLLLTIILLAGCRKEGLDLKFRTIYTSSANKSKIPAESRTATYSTEADYTQFGNFVGTITPKKVTAKFNSIRFIDRKSNAPGMQTMFEIIGVNWPADDERRFADFTNGNSIEVTPQMWGNIDNDGWFADENISLRFLGIFPEYFNVEFDLPEQFSGTGIDLRNITLRQGNTVKCNIDYFLYKIKDAGFDYEHGIQLKGFVFGETDSSYIVRQDNIPGNDITELINMAQPHSVARSGNYSCPVLTPPAEGESKIITTTIRFDSDNLIQHYAGPDNIAYTFDDVFVFQPKFWERFSIAINQN